MDIGIGRAEKSRHDGHGKAGAFERLRRRALALPALTNPSRARPYCTTDGEHRHADEDRFRDARAKRNGALWRRLPSKAQAGPVQRGVAS